MSEHPSNRWPRVGAGFLVALGLIAICLSTIGCISSTSEAHMVTPATPAKAPALLSDSDKDGLPDAAELLSQDDRKNFRTWFTDIAELQFYNNSSAWNIDQRDCAGLVRFSWREALRNHDRLWFQRMGADYKPVAPDVKAYTLGSGVLSEKLFRVREGGFTEPDIAGGAFAEFADAATLKRFNVEPLGRDRARAQPGDLLFFYQPWVQKFPFHVMIFLGASNHGAGTGHDWVVYHTGSSADAKGEVRLARLSMLDQHPDARWRPLASNKNFLGFYRLKILD